MLITQCTNNPIDYFQEMLKLVKGERQAKQENSLIMLWTTSRAGGREAVQAEVSLGAGNQLPCVTCGGTMT